MGMHIGLIAGRIPVARLREAMLQAWPELEVVASQERFADVGAMSAWMDSQQRGVPAGGSSVSRVEVYGFWQDGAWGGLLDPTYVLPSDAAGLYSLSAEIGTVVSLVVETVTGCAYFTCFEAGRLRRMINYSDGEVTTQGDPLPEEAGIDLSEFYMDEAGALCRAFGLSTLEATPKSHSFEAIGVIDHTDYSDVRAELANRARDNEADLPRTKAWWKFW